MEESKSVGLDASECEAAATALRDALKNAAREAIQAALHSLVVEELRVAVRDGEAAELDPNELQEPRIVYAKCWLQESTKNRTIIAMRCAIRYGSEWVPASDELEAAQQTLATEERRVAARQSLKTAQASRSPEELIIAMREA